MINLKVVAFTCITFMVQAYAPWSSAAQVRNLEVQRTTSETYMKAGAVQGCGVSIISHHRSDSSPGTVALVLLSINMTKPSVAGHAQETGYVQYSYSTGQVHTGAEPMPKDVKTIDKPLSWLKRDKFDVVKLYGATKTPSGESYMAGGDYLAVAKLLGGIAVGEPLYVGFGSGKSEDVYRATPALSEGDRSQLYDCISILEGSKLKTR